MTGRISVTLRVAGVVVAAGYLLGLTQGPLMMVIGALALITFGRGLVVEREHEALAGTALAVVGAALGVAALRWGTFDIGEIRGAQGVLGPTLLVGPEEVAAAAGAAAAGGAVALIVWLAEAPAPERPERWVWVAEAVAGALALVTVFGGPGTRGLHALDLALWAGATVATAGAVMGLSFVLRRAPRAVAWIACGGGAAASIAGAVFVGLM